jgi:hypothetical protein
VIFLAVFLSEILNFSVTAIWAPSSALSSVIGLTTPKLIQLKHARLNGFIKAGRGRRNSNIRRRELVDRGDNINFGQKKRTFEVEGSHQSSRIEVIFVAF